MQAQRLLSPATQGGAVEIPGEDELRCRIINHLRHSGQTLEVTHLWVGYLAALLEWGLIDHRIYVGLSRLFNGVCDDELYHLFADAPVPPTVKSTHESVGQ
ncbi:hypothetical protein [Lysobacter terrae]